METGGEESGGLVSSGDVSSSEGRGTSQPSHDCREKGRNILITTEFSSNIFIGIFLGQTIFSSSWHSLYHNSTRIRIGIAEVKIRNDDIKFSCLLILSKGRCRLTCPKREMSEEMLSCCIEGSCCRERLAAGQANGAMVEELDIMTKL